MIHNSYQESNIKNKWQKKSGCIGLLLKICKKWINNLPNLLVRPRKMMNWYKNKICTGYNCYHRRQSYYKNRVSVCTKNDAKLQRTSIIKIRHWRLHICNTNIREIYTEKNTNLFHERLMCCKCYTFMM